MRRTMAIDQAARLSGWAIYDNKKLIAHGHFSVPANKTIGQRLEAFLKELDTIIKTYHIEHLYFEGIQYQNNAETYKKLSMIQGMIFYYTQINKIPSTELTPSHWRSILKDKYGIKFGRARLEQKQKAKEFVNKQFNVFPIEDECDAICIGLAGIIEDEKEKSAF